MTAPSTRSRRCCCDDLVFAAETQQVSMQRHDSGVALPFRQSNFERSNMAGALGSPIASCAALEA